MSGESVNLVNAYMTLIPSMQGIQGHAAAALAPAVTEAEVAGKQAGGKFSGALKTGIGKAAAAGAVLGGVAAGLYAVGSTFDDVADTIRVGTGATGENLDGLIDVAKRVGTSVPAEFDAIGPVVADLNTRLGLSGETLEKVASQYLEAGRVLGEEVDINATSAAFTAFGIAGKDVEGAMDSLFQVSQATGVGMNQLASSTSTAAPAMQTLGFSFRDTASLVGILDKAGLDASKMMSGLSKGLVTLAKDGESPQAAFQRVVGEIQNFSTAGNDAAALDLASKIFGTKNAPQFVQAIQTGTLNLNDMQSALNATGDTILGVGDETKDFAEQWTIFKNKALVAIEPVASAVFGFAGDAMGKLSGAVKPVVDGLTTGFQTVSTVVKPVLEKLASLFGDGEGAMKAFGVAAAALVAGFAIYKVSMVAAKIATTAWSVVTKAAAAAQWLLNAAMSANPITLLLLAIAALVAGFVWLWNESESFRNFFIGIWEGIKAAAAAVGTWFTETLPAWFESVWQSIQDGLSALGDWFSSIWSSITTGVTNAWNSITSTVTNAWNSVWAFIQNVGSSIAGFFTGMWNGITSGISSAWNAITSTVTNAWNGVLSFVQSVGSSIGNAFRGIWNGIVTVASSVLNTLKNIVSGAINAAIDAAKFVINGGIRIANGLISGINVIIDGINLIPGVNVSHIPRIPLLAEGAFVDEATLAVVGEAGPEIVAPERKMRALLDDAVSRGGGEPRFGEGLTLNQYINTATVKSDAELQEMGADEIRALVAAFK